MEVGVFPADPRAIAAAEVLCVFAETAGFDPKTRSTGYMRRENADPGDVVVRRPAMYPQIMMSSSRAQHWRGDQRWKEQLSRSMLLRSSLVFSPCDAAWMKTIFIDTKRFFIFGMRWNRYRKAYDTHAPLFWESEPLPLTFAHMPLPKSSKATLSPSICFISKLHIGLTGLIGPADSTRRAFLCFYGARQGVEGAFQLVAFGHGRCGRRDKSGGPPLLELSLKVKRNNTHDQSSAFLDAPVSVLSTRVID